MSKARSNLLANIMEEAGTNGLADRSLRDLATAVGSSHRMLLFHFGSRAGLVSAIVETVETTQRDMFEALADSAASPSELMLAIWEQVSAKELRPFVRLFFECVALTGGRGLTDPWLEVADTAATKLGVRRDHTELRMGVALMRGLLIDVLAADDASEATASIERFIEIWDAHASSA